MTILLGLVLLLLLVLIHEAGHFVCARLFGVKVEAFSVGMGPVLLHKKTESGTDFRLSLIPLGGYCAMKGEKDFQNAIDENLTEIRSSPDSFYGTHPLRRLAIAFGGPFVNLLLGIIAFTAIAMAGYEYTSPGNKINVVEEIDGVHTPAYEAGLKSGDEIIRINDIETDDFSRIASEIGARGSEQVTVTFRRNDEIMTCTVVPLLDTKTGMGKIGIMSDKDSVTVREYPSRSFFPALAEGFSRTYNCLYLTVKGIRNLFRGVDFTSSVSGPIRITTFMGNTVKEGFSEGFRQGFIMTAELLAFISISLFFTNMLPLGIFDGGLILIAFIEWIRRKPLKPRHQLYVQYSGLAVVVFLMFFVIGGDILFLLKKN